MTQDTVVVLPSPQEIMQRLIKVHDDDRAREIYAKIAAQGGTEKVAKGIVLMFTLAIYDQVHSGMMANVMHMLVPSWIEALVDDKDVAAEAKAFHAETMKASSYGSAKQEQVSLTPPITSERQALAYLKKWINDHGYKDEIMVSASYGKRGNYWDFDIIKPYGVFLVYEDGTVDDNYGALTKK